MTSVMICDDESRMLSDISGFVSESIKDCKISAFLNGTELISAISNEKCDILLLDIDMPQLSGLDIAERISALDEKPLLIFVTGHDELVYDSLRFHPFGFVRKSFLESELAAALKDAVEELSSKDKHFCFRSSDGNVKLPLDDILYFESDGNYIKLFTKKEKYRFRDTVSSLESSLSQNGFVRIHKGFLVNQAAVKVINAEECVLTDNTHLHIGRSYSESAKKQLMRYMLR